MHESAIESSSKPYSLYQIDAISGPPGLMCSFGRGQYIQRDIYWLRSISLRALVRRSSFSSRVQNGRLKLLLLENIPRATRRITVAMSISFREYF